ncbi:cysteine desulfurase [Allocatelliglobosispora scoriae]|uniref:cysteine desulfurase n=1 Tax=Allocatelliglobosispora scoriae TaxID=643052 RepID=A0A841BXN2_9ACTN|nr:aminotransferase class V-fold PLP-dependent enzyme [Allocatelliglobosispora scoriae]MBB5871899.1 cysteine desulfurase [Allocatelliglobosispora scoriae]
MTVYLDANATTQVDGRVVDLVLRYMTLEYGNAGSRTHDMGLTAQRAVASARSQVAKVVDCQQDEVIFTSGATEANNIAILGLAPEGERSNRRHIVATSIEHKAVLEPLERLASQGFEVDLVAPDASGRVDPAAIIGKLRPDTLLVSVMAANNETGVIQAIDAICTGMADHPAYLHVDAAQAFGKLLSLVRHHRIDLMSISGHKIFAPKGVGALITRRRGYRRPPLTPLIVGGGQERGLRPGTLPVPLVAGLGLAAELAVQENTQRRLACQTYRSHVLAGLAPLNPIIHGEPDNTLPHVLNVALPGLDSEAVMVAWRGLLEVSNGSACTSASYDPSHVLVAMGLPEDQIRGALRLSWSHLTEAVDWQEAVSRVRDLLLH